MPVYSPQAPAAVVMVRPHHFTVNTQTAADNAFQRDVLDSSSHSRRAYEEITRAVDVLRKLGVGIHLFEDEGTETPDAVFPNNWFSTHSGGHIAIYPMKAPNRRKERRADVIEFLKREYRVQDVIDYSGLEPDGLFLEGTGSMVLDHIDRVAYAVNSDRTNPVALERFCTHFNFEPIVFPAEDGNGVPIYHTNVLMCVATDFALIGAELMVGSEGWRKVVPRLEQSGRDVIALDRDQIARFAGNAIELQGDKGRVLALSRTAYDALRPEQIARIEAHARIAALDIGTIELAGGSVRCTMAGVHLAPRD
ncbi:amidinotransferase [Nordella sp. HKS 07]|uniref:citrulline utilization hydrolase CtlX n=1 Tax=Nordella sp. HKS 07 TaxID=2712222 RepID=UPI0013E1ABB8|nr:arginine deiminase-related protein [Nordella sp. HKS 07]QIG49867.1 amidinotransferase [Nordella sp. HKS 07]